MRNIEKLGLSTLSDGEKKVLERMLRQACEEYDSCPEAFVDKGDESLVSMISKLEDLLEIIHWYTHR